MEMIFYGKSDIGKIRDNNEDFFVSRKFGIDEHLFIVADGMGGHQAGNVASRLGVETFVRHYGESRKKGLPINDAMLESIKRSNSAVLDKATSDLDKRGMGTTFSALLISGNKASIVHIGDSRIYLIRDDNIKRITTDHTFVEKMVDEGRITREEARRHPQKNILYMSLGARESFHPDEIKGFEVREGDIFVICSDGLTDMVTDDVIRDHCQSHSPKKAVEGLIALSNSNGGLDNVSIVVVQAGNKKKTDTEAIASRGKKNGKHLFLFLSVLFLALVIFGSVILKKEKPVLLDESVKVIKLLPLGEEEKKALELVKQGYGDESGGKNSSAVKGRPLMKKTEGEFSFFFMKEEFIVVRKGVEVFRDRYRSGEKGLILDSIYFDKSSNMLIAVDNGNRTFKILIEND